MKKIMDFFRRFHVYVYMRGFGGDGSYTDATIR